MGPILAMLISIVPSVLITWFAAKMGYQGGHECSAFKPDPEIYLRAMEALGVEPADVYKRQLQRRASGRHAEVAADGLI